MPDVRGTNTKMAGEGCWAINKTAFDKGSVVCILEGGGGRNGEGNGRG